MKCIRESCDAVAIPGRDRCRPHEDEFNALVRKIERDERNDRDFAEADHAADLRDIERDERNAERGE